MNSHQKKIKGNFQLLIVETEKLAMEDNTWCVLVNLADFYDFLKEYDQLQVFLNPEIKSSNDGIILNTDSSVFDFLNIEILIVTDEVNINSNCMEIHNIELISGLMSLKTIFDTMERGEILPENFRIIVKIVVLKDDKVNYSHPKV